MTVHIRDHGGGGPAVVLLHGAGRSLADWDDVTARLSPRHRVIAVDLPGHGRSGDLTPWTIPGVVERIGETLDAHDVDDPVVVGHSLGGFVAVEYARARPVRAAVDLDGFWWRPGEYPGTARLGERSRAHAGAVAGRDHIQEEVAQGARYGIPADRMEAAARAAARRLPDGRWQTLPERAAALQMWDELDRIGALGVTDWLAGVACPLLLVRRGRELPGLTGWLADPYTNFARDLAMDLEAVANRRESVSVVEIDATHEMVLSAPAAVAALIAGYVRGLSR